MQQTYQINTENLNSKFLEAVKAIFGKKDVKIVIEDVQPEDEQEKLFKSLFGSWEGEETGEELVKQIYSSRVSGTRDIEL
jgi:N-acetyl-beta-hexosaminidase